MERKGEGGRRGMTPRHGAATAAWALASVVLVACGAETPVPASRRSASDTAGSAAMAQRLDELIRKADPVRSILSDSPERRVDFIESRLAAAGGDLQSQVSARILLGRELLAVGRTKEGIEVYRALVADLAGRVGPRQEATLRRYLAAAHMRQAEEDNCMAGMSPRACLLPIEGSARHQRREGAEAAMQELQVALGLTPDDPGLRWLLNLAHMNLGSYPEGVPEAWRIPLDLFGADGGIAPFPNEAAAAGVDILGLSGGVAIEDFNGDGRLDIAASDWGLRGPLRMFLNRGDGTFGETTRQAGLEGLTGGLNIVHADYDNDGRPDLLVLRGAWLEDQGLYPNSLLRNLGDATFEDVTEQAGLLSFHPTQTAAWGDYDNDGDLDLFVGNESAHGTRHPCELFRNRGDGTFEEVAAAVGLAHVGFVKGVAWGDYDNDGRLDLYLSQMDAMNVLWHNDGPHSAGWSFSDVTAAAGVGEPAKSFPTWFWDYDNDGWLDLLVLPFSGFASASLNQVIAGYQGSAVAESQAHLYRNRGDGSFDDVSAASGLAHGMLAMGANFGDLDNDGWLDFYVGTGEPDLATLVPNRMYRNTGRGTFDNVTITGGFGHLQKGHGIAWGDLDNDGDQDIYEVMGGAYPADTARNTLFRNPGSTNSWITLQLVGVEANRSAIGARVRVVTDSASGRREVHATVGSGGSFGSSSLRLELGLGEAESVESVEIRWPDGSEPQRIGSLAVNAAYRVRQGQAPVREEATGGG